MRGPISEREFDAARQYRRQGYMAVVIDEAGVMCPAYADWQLAPLLALLDAEDRLARLSLPGHSRTTPR